MKTSRIPAWIKTYALFILTNWLIFTAFRGIFLFVFRSSITEAAAQQLVTTFYIGAKFDARLACALAIPLGLYLTLCAFWRAAGVVRAGVAALYGVIQTGVLLLYFADFAHYAYISMRINSSIFTYSENALISLQMAWETYPLGWSILGMLCWGAGWYLIVNKMLKYALNAPQYYRWKGKLAWFFAGLLTTGALMFGQISQYPLRWSNAYHSTNTFICNLTLNPALNLFDTYRFAGASHFDKAKTQEHYNAVARFLGVAKPDKEQLDFERIIPAKAKKDQKDYNVVFIFMESLAWNKSTMTNPDIDPTPFVKELADKSILFSRFFAPTSATARAVFATVTSIPDVTSYKTSSRNPLIVNQHVVLNALSDYDKYYFIGGSSSWGNIRGVLEHNIKNVKMYEEGHFENETRNDVWGISDLALFREVNRVLAADYKATDRKPFVAFVQTAGYHRPYTIPEDNAGFEPREIPLKTAHARSFVSVEEYNSLRFSDHALRAFFKLAEKSDYYKNTLFVIFGDHGLSAAWSDNLPRGYTEHNLINHQVPLILAGDMIKKPAKYDFAASQVDILPTVMGFLGRGYYTRAIGRDLLSTPHPQAGALLYGWAQTPHVIGFVEGDYYYHSQAGNEGLYKYTADNYNENIAPKDPKKFEHMKSLGQGLYETSRYLMYNNKKRDEQDK